MIRELWNELSGWFKEHWGKSSQREMEEWESDILGRLDNGNVPKQINEKKTWKKQNVSDVTKR